MSFIKERVCADARGEFGFWIDCPISKRKPLPDGPFVLTSCAEPPGDFSSPPSHPSWMFCLSWVPPGAPMWAATRWIIGNKTSASYTNALSGVVLLRPGDARWEDGEPQRYFGNRTSVILVWNQSGGGGMMSAFTNCSCGNPHGPGWGEVTQPGSGWQPEPVLEFAASQMDDFVEPFVVLTRAGSLPLCPYRAVSHKAKVGLEWSCRRGQMWSFCVAPHANH